MKETIISGKNQYQEMEALKKLLKKNRIPRDRVIEIDASDSRLFSIDSVMLECNSLSLFPDENKRAVVLKNPYFLKSSEKTGVAQKKKNIVREHLLIVLEEYLKDPSPDAVLVFYLDGIDVDSRKKEYKILEKAGVQSIVCNLIAYWDFPNHITELLKKAGFTMDSAARKEFDLRIGTDEFQLHQAIEKMKLYGEKNYTLPIIKELIPEDTNLDIWKLGNAFLVGDIAEMIRNRDVMYAKGVRLMDAVSRLSSQVRKAYDIRALYDLGYPNSQIAIRLRMKESVVTMNIRNTATLSSRQLLKILCALADLDQNIKNGSVDPEEGFDAFLLKYGVRNG